MAVVGIVGPGRAGLGLAGALARAGHEVFLHGRSPKPVPGGLSLTTGAVPPWLDRVAIVILAVPDDAVTEVASRLADSGAVGAGHVVLHLSGVLDRGVLSPLAPTGAALGSLHPLRSFGSGEENLEGVFAAVEGDDRAVERAVDLARSIGLRPFRLGPGGKARYHAGAVFAANFLVTLYARAERLFRDAGIPSGEARAALVALMRGVVENLADRGAGALTGPLARGDVETVRLHLEALDPQDRLLYRVLSRLTLDLAGLPEARRQALERLLDERLAGE
ncbi:hypothetical protein HRbin33_00061 [bacterium HR33]|nr:hypothetical protein HRbin33_00061 [bacterium HR33]